MRLTLATLGREGSQEFEPRQLRNPRPCLTALPMTHRVDAASAHTPYARLPEEIIRAGFVAWGRCGDFPLAYPMRAYFLPCACRPHGSRAVAPLPRRAVNPPSGVNRPRGLLGNRVNGRLCHGWVCRSPSGYGYCNRSLPMGLPTRRYPPPILLLGAVSLTTCPQAVWCFTFYHACHHGVNKLCAILRCAASSRQTRVMQSACRTCHQHDDSKFRYLAP
jgi:hypothetical protein